MEAPDRGKGSHRAFTKQEASGIIRLVIVPLAKDMPCGTLDSILEQAGISREIFQINI